ncbi:MAG: glutamate 5-kinase [candidate division NC10 bacterium]|nr:glutamate 5-kinase [candidate division NC10 bacterium]
MRRPVQPSIDRAVLLKGIRRVVVKVGSGVLSNGGFRLHHPTLERLSGELVSLRHQGLQVVLVSSGAILAGMDHLGLTKRPKSIPLKQAAAAVGQNRLMWAYEEAFQSCGQKAAQILLTQEDFRYRHRYLNARNTLFALLKLQVIPIINENDTVAVEEIKFGDNDILSALVAQLVDADLLVILTDMDGLFTADPRKDPSARLIPLVPPKGPEIPFWTGGETSLTGVGGMGAKVKAAKKAAASGIPAIVANGLKEATLTRILAGEALGTLFVPEVSRMESRKRWLAFASHPKGRIMVDEGAKTALIQRGKSLLPSGIKAVSRSFGAGDVVGLVGEDGIEFARGLTNYSAEEVERIKGRRSTEIEAALGQKPYDEVVHRDNLVILKE